MLAHIKKSQEDGAFLLTTSRRLSRKGKLEIAFSVKERDIPIFHQTLESRL